MQNVFAVHEPERATVNLSTKFAVYISTHYEGMIGNTKYREWGGLGS